MRGTPEHMERGMALFSLGQALWAAGDRERAWARVEEARQLFSGPEEGFHRRWIESWMDARRSLFQSARH